MKSLKQFIAIIVFAIISSSAFSQLSINPHLGYRLNFGEYSNNINLGFNGEYMLNNEKNVLYLGVDYYLPSSTDGTIVAYSMQDGTQESLPAAYKTNFFSISFGGKRYFAGDAEDDFAFYMRAGLGLNYGSTKAEPESYDQNLFAVSEESLEKIKLSSMSINLGLGYEKEFDFGYVFAEGNLNLNATSVNDVEVAWSLPAAFIIQAGVRFPIYF